MHSESHSDGAHSAASPFSQSQNPQLSANAHAPYGFSPDPIAWLSETWNLGKKTFQIQFLLILILGSFTALAASVVGGLFVGSGFVLGFESGPGLTMAIVGGVSAYILMAFGMFLSYCAFYLAIEQSARGDKPDVVGILRDTLALGTRMAGLYVAIITISIVLLGGIVGLGAVAAAFESAIAGIGASIVFMVVSIIVFPSLMMSIPIMSIEETSVLKSLRLGFSRTLPNLGRYFIGAIVFSIVFFGVFFVLAIPMGILSLIPFVGIVVQIAFFCAFAPFQNAWTFIVYGSFRDAEL